jgi:hypothetical protein
VETSTPEGRRRRRRVRIVLSTAAAGVAAAVAAAVLTQVAGAAPAVPEPTLRPPGYATLAAGELERRVAGALAGDDVAGAASGDETAELTELESLTSPERPNASSPTGSPTAGSSAPWMAQLWYHDDRGTPDSADDLGFFCAGSVVSPTKILTAARCVKGYNWYAFGAVVTGTTELASTGSGGTDLHGGSVTLPLRQYYDPTYDPDTSDNDIAVLTLDRPVQAQPVRMTTATDTAAYAPGTAAEVHGWGRTASDGADASPALRAATTRIRPDGDCTDGFVARHMLCTEGTQGTQGTQGTEGAQGTRRTGPAVGDLGGPLLVGDRLAGVVSEGGRIIGLPHYLGTIRARVEDANFTRDHRADVFSRRTDDRMGYFKASQGSSFDPRDEAGDWGAVNLLVQTDLNRDGFQDLVWRRDSDGDVFWAHFVPTRGDWDTQKIADDWKSRTQIVTPGDVTGDDLPDLLSVDASGVLWTYPGKGDGTFAARVRTGDGWDTYKNVLGHGDFTDDGRADLISRDEDDHLYLHAGTGKAGPGAFAAPVKVRTWKDYDLLDAVGDVNGDSRADLLARAPDGTLYLYKGTGRASPEIFATRVAAAPDYDQYDLLG